MYKMEECMGKQRCSSEGVKPVIKRGCKLLLHPKGKRKIPFEQKDQECILGFIVKK
jgi:hypothetical protein